MKQNSRFPVFRHNLNALMLDEKMNTTEFAEKLGLSRQTVGFYLNGDRIPDALTLRQICEKCSVSADWLLGLSDVKSPEMDMQVICTATGLSEAAVGYLRTFCETSDLPPKSDRLKILSALLEQKQFDLLLALWERYVTLMRMEPSLSYSQSPEYALCSAELKKHGFVVSIPDDQAQALFSERITNILRTLLDNLAGVEEI